MALDLLDLSTEWVTVIWCSWPHSLHRNRVHTIKLYDSPMSNSPVHYMDILIKEFTVNCCFVNFCCSFGSFLWFKSDHTVHVVPRSLPDLHLVMWQIYLREAKCIAEQKPTWQNRRGHSSAEKIHDIAAKSLAEQKKCLGEQISTLDEKCLEESNSAQQLGRAGMCT